MDKIREYFQTKAISNSFLKSLWNPRWVKWKFDNPDAEDDEKSHLRVGSALDCLLTSPERWETDFVVIDAKRPYGLLGKFIDKLPIGLTIESDIAEYREAYKDSGYKMWIDKVVEKFWQNEEAIKYYTLTKGLAGGVTVISSDEYEAVTKAHELVMANEYVKGYFVNEDPNIELMHQVPIYFELLDEACKALMDGIMINHSEKTIEPFDLKTSRSVHDFAEHFVQYQYFIQAAFYEIALQSPQSPVYTYFNAGYKLKNFIFIAVENKSSSSHPAIIYESTEYDRECARNGGYINNRYYKGIYELIEDYKYHKETDYWELPVELIKSKGRRVLDVFDA